MSTPATDTPPMGAAKVPRSETRTLHGLAGMGYLALVFWGPLAVGTAVVLAIIDAVARVTVSGWEVAAGVIPWFLFVLGINMVSIYLTASIAHGQTRREFTIETLVAGALIAGMFAVLTAVGFVLEWVAYSATGWTQQLSDGHLFSSPLQAHLVLVEYWPFYMAHAVLGILVGAAFYRNIGWGFAAIPVVIASVILVNVALRGSVDPIDSIAFGWRPAVEGAVPALAAVGACVAVTALGAAVSWWLLRGVPIRNKST